MSQRGKLVGRKFMFAIFMVRANGTLSDRTAVTAFRALICLAAAICALICLAAAICESMMVAARCRSSPAAISSLLLPQ